MRIFSTIAMGIGRDHGSPVSKRYVDDFAFEGGSSGGHPTDLSGQPRREGGGGPRGNGPAIEHGTTTHTRRELRGLSGFDFAPHYADVADPSGGEALRMAYLDEDRAMAKPWCCCTVNLRGRTCTAS